MLYHWCETTLFPKVCHSLDGDDSFEPDCNSNIYEIQAEISAHVNRSLKRTIGNSLVLGLFVRIITITIYILVYFMIYFLTIESFFFFVSATNTYFSVKTTLVTVISPAEPSTIAAESRPR